MDCFIGYLPDIVWRDRYSRGGLTYQHCCPRQGTYELVRAMSKLEDGLLEKGSNYVEQETGLLLTS